MVASTDQRRMRRDLDVRLLPRRKWQLRASFASPLRQFSFFRLRPTDRRDRPSFYRRSGLSIKEGRPSRMRPDVSNVWNVLSVSSVSSGTMAENGTSNLTAPTPDAANGRVPPGRASLGRADDALMGFTDGMVPSVQGRLGGTAANVSVMQVVSFAPTSASGRTNEAFAAIDAGTNRSRERSSGRR